MSAPWSTLTGAIRYGFAPHYILRIEGIPLLPVEAVLDANAPTGYTLDASLVIDGSARIGSVLSDKDHFAGAKDLEFRLTDTPAVRALMGRPTAQTTITAEFAHDATTMAVDSTAGFPTAASTIYFGTSCLEKTGYLYDAFTSLDRSVYGPAKTYPAETVVTDSPGDWKRRRVELFMALIDPTGRYVVTSGGDILSQACCIWTGYMSARPVRNGTEWECLASDQVQRLRAPLSASAQGTASWALDDDGALLVDRAMVIRLRVHTDPTGPITDVSARPFGDEPAGPIKRSRIRTLISEKLLAAIVAANAATPIDLIGWEKLDYPEGGALAREWGMWVRVVGTTDPLQQATVSVSGNGLESGLYVFGPTRYGFYVTETVKTSLAMRTQITDGALAVVIEEGDPAALPASGFIRLEGGDRKQILEYTSLSVDGANGAKVHLQLAAGSQPIGSDLAMLAADEVSGESAELSVTFLWRDEGPVEDVLRRAIVSTGDAVNGAYDTLARGQGYAMPDIDAQSFADAFDGAFGMLSVVLAVDAGTSLANLMGGLLKLSQRGVAARRAADGSAVELAAVNVGSPDTLDVAATIRDADLAFVDRSTRPIRVRSSFAAPQMIEIACKTADIGDQEGSEGVIIAKSKDVADHTDDAWKLDVYGIDRATLLLPAQAWASSWFQSYERQIVEIDLPPWQDVQVGDVLALDLDDVALWDYSRGAPGYHGLARVLGVQLRLETGAQTVEVALDGKRTAPPMAPSIPVVAVNGADPTAPTSIDVAESWFALLTLAIAGDGPWYLLVYLPGADDGAGQFAVDAIVLTGGVCRITFDDVAAMVTRTFTTDDRVTFPVAAFCAAGQLRYLQNTDIVQWS